MKYVIMHGVVVKHDAVGNDIEAMCHILNRGDNTCKVYARIHNIDTIEYIELDELKKELEDPEVVVIYHHSVFWKVGYDLIKQAKGPVIIKYHNITPGKFFKTYHNGAYHECKSGRRQTVTMQKELTKAFWLSDSVYNDSEIDLVPAERKGICPPFHKIEEWTKAEPDQDILSTLKAEKQLNLLFVGRTAPNKGHLMMLDVIKAYRHYYDDNIHLRIIGKMGMIPNYDQIIRNRILEYGLSDFVEFIGEINDSTLMAYYKGSDIFLCCSEHEGFCVPVIESEYFGIPMVALKEAAVPETMGDKSLLVNKEEGPEAFAAILHTLYENSEYGKEIGRLGNENYTNRFTNKAMEECFLKEMDRALKVIADMN